MCSYIEKYEYLYSNKSLETPYLHFDIEQTYTHTHTFILITHSYLLSVTMNGGGDLSHALNRDGRPKQRHKKSGHNSTTVIIIIIIGGTIHSSTTHTHITRSYILFLPDRNSIYTTKLTTKHMRCEREGKSTPPVIIVLRVTSARRKVHFPALPAIQ